LVDPTSRRAIRVLPFTLTRAPLRPGRRVTPGSLAVGTSKVTGRRFNIGWPSSRQALVAPRCQSTFITSRIQLGYPTPGLRASSTGSRLCDHAKLPRQSPTPTGDVVNVARWRPEISARAGVLRIRRDDVQSGGDCMSARRYIANLMLSVVANVRFRARCELLAPREWRSLAMFHKPTRARSVGRRSGGPIEAPITADSGTVVCGPVGDGCCVSPRRRNPVAPKERSCTGSRKMCGQWKRGKADLADWKN